ncbi:hypothetical protein RclHR1_11780001 [Rhizophagus clarus]|nr:hypothetical protein RclHR1_11780001 [Rhizophagus clarus]
MQQCWDNDPEKCPTTSYLNEKLGEWIILICDDPNPSQISDENSIAEEKRWKMISKLNNRPTHPEYYENGNLYRYFNGRVMIDVLWGIAGGLERIHSEIKIYENFH